MRNVLWIFTGILSLILSVSGQNLPKSAYVVNTLGQNLAVVDLENQTVNPDALPLGLYTNQIVLRGETAYVVNSGVNSVQVIGLNPLNTLRNIDLGSGTNPWNIVFLNDSIAFVSELFTNQVAKINVASGQVGPAAVVGSGPEGMYLAGGKLFVACSGFNGAGYDPGRVFVLDPQAMLVVDTLAVGTNPQDITADSLGHLVVACTGDYVSEFGSLHIFDLTTLQPVDTVLSNFSVTAVRALADSRLLIGTFGSGVLVYNQSVGSFDVDESQPLPGGPGLAVDADQNIYITDFSADSLRIYNSAYQKTAAYLVGDGPVSVALYQPATSAITESPDQKLAGFRLLGNYPNPFNPATTITFTLPKTSLVRLDVFNLRGQRVASLVNGTLPAGEHQVVWHGTDNTRRAVSSGVYFYRLRANGRTAVGQMILSR